MFCPKCGSQNDDGCNFCKVCGVNLLIAQNTNDARNVCDKNWLTTLLLCIFIGALGIHRFYVGKIFTGILMILTFGGFGVWVLIDIIMIATNTFTDKKGLKLNKNFNKNFYRY